MNSLSLSESWIGRSIGDRHRYCIQQSIGGGSMGDVFLATDTRLGQPVALKILKGNWVGAPELHRRFEHEVALCAALKGDHIVQVSDYGISDEGYPFYVMEYLQGQTLGQLLRSSKRLPVQRAINIVTQVCEGLKLAHGGVTLPGKGDRTKVVHRDLKPENIFIIKTSLGELAKILDFGIAKIQTEQRENTHLTQVFIGTFHYASPEQVEVRQDLDGRSDIYSLGVILYELLCGTDPFGFGETAREMSQMSWAVAHASRLPIPLRHQPGCEAFPEAVEAAVMRCLEKQPGDRFPTVQALSQALQSIDLSTEPIFVPHPAVQAATQVAAPNPIPLARPVPLPTKINHATASTLPPRRVAVWVAIAGFILAISVSGAFLWLQHLGSKSSSKLSPSPSPKASLSPSPSPKISPSASPVKAIEPSTPASPIVPPATGTNSGENSGSNVDVDKIIQEYRREPIAPAPVEPDPVVVQPPARAADPAPNWSEPPPSQGWEDIPPDSGGNSSGNWEDNTGNAPPATDNSGGI
jgi:serine/threonine protein kinase